MKTDKKIFFMGSIRGGRVNQPHYAEIVEILEQYGTVLSEHVADKSLGEYGETDLEKEEIHDRELDTLHKSDVVVAEVTTPSLGVGYLIAQAIHLNKKVIALYNGEDTLKLSAMIKGNKNVGVYLYKTREDLIAILNSEVN
ncbi:MAG: nucleoside 2-deoxyribosyltransferase [Patescibacteria group bacterium]|nr:nucleoside 2-deoxyribosyltransferase [Patescibacteria group bacterium]